MTHRTENPNTSNVELAYINHKERKSRKKQENSIESIENYATFGVNIIYFYKCYE